MPEEPQTTDGRESPASEELAETELNDVAGGTGTGAIIPHGPPTPGG
jgi:hypothetical protein